MQFDGFIFAHLSCHLHEVKPRNLSAWVTANLRKPAEKLQRKPVKLTARRRTEDEKKPKPLMHSLLLLHSCSIDFGIYQNMVTGTRFHPY